VMFLLPKILILIVPKHHGDLIATFSFNNGYGFAIKK